MFTSEKKDHQIRKTNALSISDGKTHLKNTATLGVLGSAAFSGLAGVSAFLMLFMIWLSSGLGLWNWVAGTRDRFDSRTGAAGVLGVSAFRFLGCLIAAGGAFGGDPGVLGRLAAREAEEAGDVASFAGLAAGDFPFLCSDFSGV